MAKEILFNEKAQQALKRGVDAVANAVRVTIGPRGKNVVLSKGFGGPVITNDGVSIAKEIDLKDPFEKLGAEIIKEVANKTNDNAGDGTTTSVLLTHAMVEEGYKKLAMGMNAMNVRRGIEQASEEAVKSLKRMAKQVKGKDEIKHVATISAESEELGSIIAETIEKVGKDGVVTVEESQTIGVESEVVEGIQFDKGYISPYMITNSERMEAEYKNPAVLVTDKKISAIKDILPLLENLSQAGKKDLVIIADDVEGEALATFVVNKLRGGFNVLAVKAPGFGDRKKAQLEDIAVTVGAEVISDDVGITFENADVSMLGSANRIVSTKDNTIIVGGKGKKADIEKRVAQLKVQLDTTDSKFDQEKIEERIAKLSGGVAVIRVGAATETEMKYLKLKIEDAVHATKAAIEEGIVPGGGTALVKVASTLSGKAPTDNQEVASGYDIVVRSLSEPLKQIIRNSGKENGAVIIDKVQSGTERTGYDAQRDIIVSDMLKAGIVDPVKVTRMALQNAASAAAILLTTEVAVAEIPEEGKREDTAGMPPMGM